MDINEIMNVWIVHVGDIKNHMFGVIIRIVGVKSGAGEDVRSGIVMIIVGIIIITSLGKVISVKDIIGGGEMQYKVSQKQVQGISTASRVLERVTNLERGISGSGEDFRKDMATSALENLPNPGAIERHVTCLEDYGLGEDARKLRLRYQHIQRFSQGEISKEG